MKAPQIKRAVPVARAAQRGVALISSLLLLVIITILALSMFRSFPTQEKIAGNVREKERAYHAANSALSFAEFWLAAQPYVSTAAVPYTAQAAPFDGNVMQGQIYNTPLYALPGQPAGLVGNVTTVPWTFGGALIGTQYVPNGMTIAGAGVPLDAPNNDTTYAAAPVYYIADLGTAADNKGHVFQIDAYAYGGSTNTVAVVESVYEIAAGVNGLNGP